MTFGILLQNINILIIVKNVQIRNFLWSVFSRIQTEYGELECKSPYSLRILENTEQKKLHTWTFFTIIRIIIRMIILVN